MRSYLCVWDIDFASFHDFFSDFGTISTVWYFFVFDFISADVIDVCFFM